MNIVSTTISDYFYTSDKGLIFTCPLTATVKAGDLIKFNTVVYKVLRVVTGDTHLGLFSKAIERVCSNCVFWGNPDFYVQTAKFDEFHGFAECYLPLEDKPQMMSVGDVWTRFDFYCKQHRNKVKESSLDGV